MREVRTIDSAEAWSLANTVVELAAADGGGPIVVSVFAADGAELAYRSMDGVPAGFAAIGRAKANTAFRERPATSTMTGVNPADWAAPGMTTFGGGIPVVEPHSGLFVGAMGVCGRTSDEDGRLGYEAIATLWPTLNGNPARSPIV